MTTAADLLAAIEARDPQVCVQLLTGLDEQSRRALYPAVAGRITELDREIRENSGTPRSDSFKRYGVARVALLGVATLGELKKLGSWPFPGGDAAAVILADRRPDWLKQWAEFDLTRNPRVWSTVRALVRTGMIPPPTTEFYTLGMIAAPNRHTPPRQLLQQDPGLLDDELWRVFEHEGSGELSLAAYDKYVHESNTWFAAFLAMAADGTVDRVRVLQSTLDALQRDFAPFRAGWYSRLHEALKPTGPERVELCDRYLDLMTSRVPATVSFAMKAVVEAQKAGGLRVEKIVDRLAPAFEARDKGTVQRALTLVKKLAKKADGATKARVAALAARALGHESADVQSLALEVVGPDPAAVAPYMEVLAPSVRAGLVGATAIADDAPKSGMVEVAPSQVNPILDLEELVQTFAAVLENEGPPVDIERVIDGVVRIGIPAATHYGAFERLTGALAKRAEKLLSRSRSAQPVGALGGLALAWARGQRSTAPEAEQNLAHFLIWRLWCASEQVAQRIGQPLLSLPTSPDGRIEVGEFERRLTALTPAQRTAAESNQSLFHLDLLLARLRTYGCANPVKFRLVWNKKTWEVKERTYHYYHTSLETDGLPKPSRLDPAALTAATLSVTPQMKRWCATVSPRWLEGWFAAGCRELGGNIEWWQADWSTRAYLEPLVNPETSIGQMGALLIALGLGAKEVGESGLATDALIAGVSDSRLDATIIGNALIEAASSGAIKFSRWARQLQKAAQAGASPARAIFLALEMLLESAHGADGGDFGRLVELEHELAHLTGLRLTRAGALRTISNLTTGGKTARAARGLLAAGA